ncbi:MAG TPA: patatin-like phospholipase family protein [Bryobacteraceae bacterium]|nr:patatin-like phospholipase family protein [Bryobacteraceae bacterium]
MITRALVLGGGGPVGIAWEAGLLAGFSQAGLDLSQADFIVGTSAGSVVGAQVAMGGSITALADAIASEDPEHPPPSPSRSLGSGPPDLSVLIQKMHKAASSTDPPEQVRAELGAFALQAKTMSEDAFVTSFAPAIRDYPEGFWPDRFACTAVDTADGSFMLWNRDSHVGLARAVASSCCVPGIYPPVTINGRRYMDGGMKSAINADVAKGYNVVFVVAPTGTMAAPGMEGFRRRIEAELEIVRASGSRLEFIAPDAASMESFGLNLMDYRRRPAAAKAGLNQGRADAARLCGAWQPL